MASSSIGGQFSAGTVEETVNIGILKGAIIHWHVGFTPSRELVSTVSGAIAGALLSNDSNSRLLLSALGGVVGYALSSGIFQQSVTYIQNNYMYNTINVIAVPKMAKATD